MIIGYYNTGMVGICVQNNVIVSFFSRSFLKPSVLKHIIPYTEMQSSIREGSVLSVFCPKSSSFLSKKLLSFIDFSKEFGLQLVQSAIGFYIVALHESEISEIDITMLYYSIASSVIWQSVRAWTKVRKEKGWVEMWTHIDPYDDLDF